MERKEEVKFGGAAMSLPAELSCLQGGEGAEGEAALATLEKQLICPICLELFNKPVVILPCQHNLCRKCANELYQPSLFQARTTMQVNSGRFRCPSCRQEVVLDRHGVYGLQRNLLVENIIDVYKQEVSNNSNAASPPPPPLPAQVTCSDHEGERVNIYCLTCQVPTCSLCKVFGAHQSCQVAPLTDIYQQKKDELNEGVGSLVSVNDKVQALINELEETCKNIEENCKTQKQSVCEKFDRVFSILEEKRKVMTQRISSEQEAKTSHAQSLMRRYGDSVEANSKLMERAASSMEEPDMAAFVQNSRELINIVRTASGSCPAETLKPGYETLSRYIFNFSRQETALKSIDFLKVLQNVPEEPEVEKEPEEPKEPSVQIVEPKHIQETSPQNPDSVVEPVEELIPTLISPPVKPAAPTSAPVPPAPGLVRDSVEPAGAVLQPETEDPDLNDGESSLTKNETEDQKERAEGCAAAGPGKEGAVCEEEGMSTQQCETVSDAGDWTAQSETEDKQDAQEEEKEEEEMKEGEDAPFYPNWYKPNSWRRLCSDPTGVPKVCDAHQTMSSQPAEESCSEAEIHTEVERAVQVVSEPQIQPQSLWSLVTQTQTQEQNQHPPGPQQLPHQSESQPLSHLQSQPQKVSVELGRAITPVPLVRLSRQRAGEREEKEEEKGMHGWVCRPDAVEKSFSLVEGSFHLGDGGSEYIDSPSSVPAERARSGVERGSSVMDKDNVEVSDRRAEEAEEKVQHDDDHLDLKCASELKDRRLGEGDAETMNKALEEGDMWSDERKEKTDDLLIKEDSCEPQNVSLDAGDHGVEATNSLVQGDTEIEAVSSEFAEKREDGENREKDGENSEPPEDLKTESGEKITPSVSLQAVILLFYLLAFLVLLQKVWSYIGCFI